MKRTSFFWIIIAFIFITITYFIFSNRQNTDNSPVEEEPKIHINKENKPIETKQDNNIIPDKKAIEKVKKDTVEEVKNNTESEKDDWKKYTNKQIGFLFQYPPNWKQNGDAINAVGIDGIIKSVEIYFIDTTTNSNMLVKYHPNPGGTSLFDYKIAQYESSKGIYKTEKKNLIIDGYKAIYGSEIRNRNGKGQLIDPSEKIIVIDFLCDELGGKMEFQFRIALNKTQITLEKQFNQIINSFQITNK